MYSISLIFTRHEECGQCTLDALYNIIESIGPDVIFEEVPPSYFDRYYVNKTKSNLESDTIHKYAEKYCIQHIPVDSDDVPSDSFFNDLQELHRRVEGLADINGYNYRTYTDSLRENIRILGFRYLNSIYCSNAQKEISYAIEKGVQKINDEKLSRTLKQWKMINDNRENEIIKNIYNYSKGNQYTKAVFLIGSGHINSIIPKISEYKMKKTLSINWISFKKIDQ